MFRLTKPSQDDIRRFVESQKSLDLTYSAVGATAHEPPPGYSVDRARNRLGEGKAVFDAAREALRRWDQFRVGWVEPGCPDAALETGQIVAVLAHAWGLWVLSACRIVYVVDEEGPVARFGFGYGTLPAHVESGEERFLIEWDRANDTVWYDVSAFFRPRHPLVRLGWPVAQSLVNRFRRDSAASMERAVAQSR